MASQKIMKPNGLEADELETKIATELYNLEMSANDLKPVLRNMYITGAKEVDIGGGRKSIIIYVPFKLLAGFHKVQPKVVRELEKKFSNKHIMVIAQRTILSKSFSRKAGSSGLRPRSRTLTAVQDAILDDIVFPTEIVGKRTRCKTDGSKVLKVILDEKDKVNIEARLSTYAAVYRKLTSKTVTFAF